MADQLRLRVVLDLAERVLAPMKRISGASGDTARALKAARDRLKELNDQQAAVGNVQKHAAELARLNNALKVKQALLDGMRASGTATAAQLKREENGVRKLADALELQKAAAVKARAALNAMGVTGNLAAAQARLKTDIDSATSAMAKQRAELQRLGAQQRHLQELRDKHSKALLHAGVVAGAGVAMQAAGRRGVDVGMGPVKNYSKHEDAMIGIARQVPGARDEMGKLAEVYRQAERDVRELSGRIPLATTEITNMMTASARMEVPTDKLKEFTLMASEMATAFDAVPDEITERMGKVAKTFNIPLTEIRGLADSINFLDDNAISKGADIIDFITRVSGVAASAKMDPRDYAALGSTLLTLGERTETAGTATNSILQTIAAATKGTKGFRSALGELNLSAEELERGMTRDAMGTLNKVMEAINALPEEKRLGVMVELVGKEHSDTLAKLVANPDELARQRGLATGDKAKGSMGREAEARNQALSAQWQMTKNRAFNLSATVGETLAPALLQLLKAINPLIERFGKFVEQHPALVKWVVGSAVAVSGLMAVLGMLLVPLALVFGKAMLLRYAFAWLSATLFGAKAATGAAAAGMGLLYRVGYLAGQAFALLSGGAGVLLAVLRTVAVFLLANPIVAALALMATAAYMVWRNWDGIKGGLLAIWQQLSGAVSAWWASTAAGAAALWQDLVALKDRFFSAGSDLMDGLMNGITSRLAAVREAVTGVAEAIGAWFREKLGIASPSKVFMQYGGWISEGAALGIAGGQGAVRTAALAMATAATATMPLAADAAALSIDARAPLSAAGAVAPAGMGGGNTYNITINAAPGMDDKALARAITAELDRRERAGRSRALSSLHDID
ncbi:phage tail tape measure protein [Acidovorax sp. LjRoot129]|uniref:phage tail tape measure protein n=1 Tax=Acidovorax sp. LjRoot129 TaxID=3342260 RepID=UPI003ECDA9CA